MPDDDTAPLPAWARDLKPPQPITETQRQMLILLEIKRQQDNYREANPTRATGQGEEERERDGTIHTKDDG